VGWETEHWKYVAELVTPVLISGRLFTHQGIFDSSGTWQQYLINLTSNGCAYVFLYLGNQDYPWIPTYGPFVPD